MNRLKDTFAQLRANNQTALIPFITAGYPKREVFPKLLHDMVSVGADVIELGMPFSDPMADGPIIQHSSDVALANGMSLNGFLQIVTDFRKHDEATPIVLMGYLNPIIAMGVDTFMQKAVKAGIDGILLVDSPPEENSHLLNIAKQNNIDIIFLTAPTTSSERMQMICKQATGFVYYVSIKGVTGDSTLDFSSVKEKIQEIKMHSSVPVGVGFGISTPEQAEQISSIADAVVVGSALIKVLGQDDYDGAREQMLDLLSRMREAMDAKNNNDLTTMPNKKNIEGYERALI